MKFIVNSAGLETDFSELKGPVDFLDSNKKREISIEEAQYKQKEFDGYLKKKELEILLKNKKKRWIIIICFLMEEMMLLNL